MFLGTLFLP